MAIRFGDGLSCEEVLRGWEHQYHATFRADKSEYLANVSILSCESGSHLVTLLIDKTDETALERMAEERRASLMVKSLITIPATGMLGQAPLLPSQ